MDELLKEFIEWYEWSGYDVFEIFDRKEEIIRQFLHEKDS